MGDGSVRDTTGSRGGAGGWIAAAAPTVLLAGMFAGLAAASWGRWPDVLVDFGTELYVAWRITLGEVVGRDLVVWGSGPLSAYVNGAVFAAFGPGVRTLVVANLAWTALQTWLLYVLLRHLGSRLSATLACAAFLAIFAFGQYEPIGNSNWVTPYAHAATHGMVLAHVALWALHRYARTRSAATLAAAGGALGLVSLTKIEVLVAAALAVGLGIVLVLRDVPDARARARAALVLAGSAALPPLVAVGLLAARSGLSSAVAATFAPWLTLATPLTALPFYRWGLGIDAPAANLLRALGWLAGWSAVVGAATLVDWRVRAARWRWGAAFLAAGAVAGGAWLLLSDAAWLEIARPLPFAAAALTVGAVRAGPRPRSPDAALRASYAVFATALLLKMVLNARLWHYGFTLALPATALVVTWLAAAWPGTVATATALAVVAVTAAAHVHIASRFYADKTVEVGTGADAFLADRRGHFVAAVLRALPEAADPGAALAVVPEGVMINYLSRRPHPLPWFSYMPDALAVVGERTMRSRLEQSRPPLVLVLQRDASEHGAAVFGRDYARETRAWLEAEYEPIAAMGGSPYALRGYGLVLYGRRGAAAPPPPGGARARR